MSGLPLIWPLTQIILRAVPHGGHGQLLVVVAGHHNHRDVRRHFLQRMERRQPLAVRQAEVQQNQINVLARQPGERLGKLRRGLDLETQRPGWRQHLADEIGVRRIVFHDQDAQMIVHVMRRPHLTGIPRRLRPKPDSRGPTRRGGRRDSI